MLAIVTKEFPGRPDNEINTRTIRVGEEISGELAAVAVRERWAVPADEEGSSTADDTDAPDLAELKKADLLRLAEAEGIPVDHSMTKAILIEAITAARAAKDA